MISDKTWDRFQKQYGVDGYTDSIVFIKLDKLVELDSKLEAIKKIANNPYPTNPFRLNKIREILNSEFKEKDDDSI